MPDYGNHNKGFKRMALPEAKKECNTKLDSYVRAECNRCEMAVMLHCSDCNIQITGCFCSDEDRFGKNEAIQKMIDRMGFEKAKEKLTRQGIWVPPGVKG